MAQAYKGGQKWHKRTTDSRDIDWSEVKSIQQEIDSVWKREDKILGTTYKDKMATMGGTEIQSFFMLQQFKEESAINCRELKMVMGNGWKDKKRWK